jgi:hypothetical protein
MTTDLLRFYREVWCVDFEFRASAGSRPTPVCLVAREFRSGRLLRVWADELHRITTPPYAIGPDSLFVAYFASAELGCHLALGWPLPARVLDLYAEFRCKTSGLPTPCGAGLLGALAYHGLDSIDVTEKDSMRDLILRGEPYTAEECRAILDYCQTDVDALAALLPVMLPKIDLPRALFRGRYMTAVARMEFNGVPIDTDTLDLLRSKWEHVQGRLIEKIDAGFGVYDGNTFKQDRWATWLASREIPWPRLPSGSLCLKDDTFKEMARSYPAVAPIRELRTTLSQLRVHELAVGLDARNRVLLSPFGSKTGRNQPSNSKFVFGPSAWLRSLIKPAPGRAVAYVDWSQQELAIAAALSGDEQMQQAYRSGDFYLSFAKMAGAVPPDATKKTHAAQREQFKTVSLGVLYGLSDYGLAMKLGIPTAYGRDLLRMHKDVFRRFWKWSDMVRDEGMLAGKLTTVFGWEAHTGKDANALSLRNFPMQGNGAEMMRVACCLATEEGITICCPVHDALLVEAGAAEIDAVVLRTQQIMQHASELVLDGFGLGTEAKLVKYPNRYMDPRGEVMWRTVMELCGRRADE